MLEVKNIHKSFGKLEVLKGIDLSIKKGEIVSITGPSGAGKTTLLQIMGTLLKPTSGKVFIGGKDVFAMKDDQLAGFRNSEIGFVFQFHHLLPEFSAVENVIIPALIARKKKKDAIEKAKSLLEELNLGHRLNHKPGELSGGEQQRVSVARALMNDPLLVLADEPSGNLDSVHKTELHQLFFDLRDRYNQTFVIVTHDNELAAKADRQIKLADGLVIAQ
ncbi:MAG TPA: ABC transporter ATP-binding protein [Bacteroidales bacterium]|nr:ABC transporter ATP-binding protein [Bacteroidales bacterium]